MNEIIKKIDVAQHIVLLVNKDIDAICAASALYTYILRLHKKVSFVCLDTFFLHKLSFLPWSEKIKNQLPASADLVLSFGEVSLESETSNLVLLEQKNSGYAHSMYAFFRAHAMKINEKMATALCCGLIYKSDFFANQEVDGTTFAYMSELIEAGAHYATCHKHIVKMRSLSALRFKAYVIENMDLLCDASLAYVNINETHLLAYGVCEEDFFYALREQLTLPSVKVSLLVYENKASFKKVYILSNEEQNLYEIFSGFEISGTKQQMCIDFAHRSNEEIETTIIKLLKEGQLF